MTYCKSIPRIRIYPESKVFVIKGFENIPKLVSVGIVSLHSTAVYWEGASPCTLARYIVLSSFLVFAYLIGEKNNLVAMICISLILSEVEYQILD